MKDDAWKNHMKANLEKLRPLIDDVRQQSPLVLAYIGDALYELAVRSRVVQGQTAPMQTLHEQTKNQVQASAQAKMLHTIHDQLTPDEQAIMRRARNTKVNVPASASPADYRYSTAFEAVLGYLFLDGQLERLTALLDQVVQEGQIQSE